jgi:hypothetical protein
MRSGAEREGTHGPRLENANSVRADGLTFEGFIAGKAFDNRNIGCGIAPDQSCVKLSPVPGHRSSVHPQQAHRASKVARFGNKPFPQRPRLWDHDHHGSEL